MPAASAPAPAPRSSYATGFIAASAAPALSALFTNPIEVVKIRQQVDPRAGGLLSTLQRIYVGHGLAGLQSGLQMSVMREASKSFFRIGLFEPILNTFHDKNEGPAPIYKRMAAGMTSGATAALVCNPIELVKTRQQAQGSGVSSFKYKGPIDGMRQLHAAEGVAGMWRGTPVSMVRSAMVTGPHLTTYTGVKETFVANGWMGDATPLHIVASLCGGLAGICCNHPLDLVRNRLYNQPINEPPLYTSAVDCARKVLASDGVLGFYRGFWSHYMRVGPHYVITFVFLEKIKKLLQR